MLYYSLLWYTQIPSFISIMLPFRYIQTIDNVTCVHLENETHVLLEKMEIAFKKYDSDCCISLFLQ